jgi:hypothetical protein
MKANEQLLLMFYILSSTMSVKCTIMYNCIGGVMVSEIVVSLRYKYPILGNLNHKNMVSNGSK